MRFFVAFFLVLFLLPPPVYALQAPAAATAQTAEPDWLKADVTYADVAAHLLRRAATFFRSVGTDPKNQRLNLKEKLDKNASVYDRVAALVEKDPLARPEVLHQGVPQTAKATNAQVAAKLLRDAAIFFRQIAPQNPTLKQQMDDNASIYDQVADLIEKDPSGHTTPAPGTATEKK